MKKKPITEKVKKVSANDDTPQPKYKTICIIPARSGSKGLPDKNIKPLCGQPVIWWTVDVAKRAQLIDRIIVSTDSPQYQDLVDGRCGKGLVPFLRPGDLSKDTSFVKEAILYTLDKMERDWQERFDIVLLLEPTSPIRTPEQINEIINILKNERRYRSIVSVFCDPQCNPLYAFDMADDKHLRPFDGARQYPDGNMRRQAMRKAWYMDGSFYASYIDTYRERGAFVHDLTLGYPVPGWQSDEIDYDYDLVKIEAIMKWRKG